MEEILGRKFINNKNEEIDPQEVYKCKIICLFFTASWCSPCEMFSKELYEVYSEGNQGEKLLEIIQINYEKNDQLNINNANINMKQILGDKPWIFIPLNDAKIEDLTKRFSIETIPVFIVMDQNGKIISQTARADIVKDGPKVVDKWLDLIGHRYQ